MKAKTLQIFWHEKQPVYSVDFEPGSESTGRFATSGADSAVRMWRLATNVESGLPHVEYLSSLMRHSLPVNCVRWHPKGGVLASGGDDASVLIWKRADEIDKQLGNDFQEFDVETWKVQSVLKGVKDIYDLCWSPDGKYIMTSSTDNCVRIWDLGSSQNIHLINDHSHFVQGVAWDPLDIFLVSQSSDRNLNFYTHKIAKNGHFSTPCVGRVSKFIDLRNRDKKSLNETSVARIDSNENTVGTTNIIESDLVMPTSTATDVDGDADGDANGDVDEDVNMEPIATDSTILATTSTNEAKKPREKHGYKMYYEENLTTFFRRLCFTRDGSLLITPAGLFKRDGNLSKDAKGEESYENAVWVYTRGNFGKGPSVCYPGLDRPAIAIRVCPVIFHLRKPAQDALGNTPTATPTKPKPPTTTMPPTSGSDQSLFDLKYRHVFAVATQDALFLYDTQHTLPIGLAKGLHFTTCTDLAWSHDGRSLVMTSTDGFCSMVSFDENEIGVPLSPSELVDLLPSLQAPIEDKDRIVLSSIVPTSPLSDPASLSLDQVFKVPLPLEPRPQTMDNGPAVSVSAPAPAEPKTPAPTKLFFSSPAAAPLQPTTLSNSNPNPGPKRTTNPPKEDGGKPKKRRIAPTFVAALP